MIEPPVINTERLHLRQLTTADASAIQRAAASREIADTMISIPHPYPEGEAGRYITRKLSEQESDIAVAFVLEEKGSGSFCGLIELRNIDREHLQGELSFWLAPECRGRGYMGEALQAMVAYGFEDLELNRLYAYHMVRNPASGIILEKGGFNQEGILRQRVRKWGEFEDVALWASLKHEWRAVRSC